MGLTIHYSGKFRIDASLPEMIEEVTEIAQTHHWKYHLFEKEFNANPDHLHVTELMERRYGIMLFPPGSEPVHLYFNARRQLGFMIPDWKMQGQQVYTESGQPSSHYSAFTKTAYSDATTHMRIVNLLRYVFKKYLEDYQMLDESGYWETGDEKLLRAKFGEYGFGDKMDRGFHHRVAKEPGESTEEYLKRRQNRN
jgi:hypothetical protein